MLILNKELCISCGVCEESCPFGAITLQDGYPVIGDTCTLCGTCVDTCSAEALSISVEKVGQSDLDEWRGVAVYCEYYRGELNPVSLELLGEGRRLADMRGVELSALLFGGRFSGELDGVAAELIAHGADRVYVVAADALSTFREDLYCRLTVALLRRYKPEIVLAGATAVGRAFIPAVAVTMHAGLTADCTSLDLRESDGSLLQTRPAFGGNIMATIVCENTRPQMATVRPRVMKALDRDDTRDGEVIVLEAGELLPEEGGLDSRVEVLESVAGASGAVNIQEADVLVAGGRGLENAEGFELLAELAELLDGKISASRAVVDAGWIPYPHQVGQTGKTVAPKIYIACGISGAVQHVAGMQSAETIIAINRDENAPIFNIADYGIVGNLSEVLPALIARVKELS
jgi:electron transfer flavoprotein alpha subunit